MLALLLYVSLGLSSRMETANCDLVEVNNFYDENGIIQFRQLIFYDWNPEHRRFDTLAIEPPNEHDGESDIDGPPCFLILSEDDIVAHLPVKQGGSYVVLLSKQRREIRARMFHETWTLYDREKAKRHLVKSTERRVLFPQRDER